MTLIRGRVYLSSTCVVALSGAVSGRTGRGYIDIDILTDLDLDLDLDLDIDRDIDIDIDIDLDINSLF